MNEKYMEFEKGVFWIIFVGSSHLTRTKVLHLSVLEPSRSFDGLGIEQLLFDIEEENGSGGICVKFSDGEGGTDDEGCGPQDGCGGDHEGMAESDDG